METRSCEREFPEITWVKNRVIFAIAPRVSDSSVNVSKAVTAALSNPISSSPLREIIRQGSWVLLLADDITRATPRQLIIPPILDELNKTGIPDENINILIALGTHRSMSKSEIEEAFGKEVTQRVEINNHAFRDSKQLINIGHTGKGTPIIINRKVKEADFVLGIGSIVPHTEAGWSGGAKILQPGVCGEETTACTHMLAVRTPGYLEHCSLAGFTENPVRLEIEQVALRAGLHFIVNVVFDGAGKVVKVVAGDPVAAHRAGVATARKYFLQVLPERADIVVVDARPADIDLWQGLKPLAFATRAVREGGIAILVADFPDGISPVYSQEWLMFGDKTCVELRNAEKTGQLAKGVCAQGLYLHAAVKEKVKVICVSDGISIIEKKDLGFLHAKTTDEALHLALEEKGRDATVGLILQGGNVLPYNEYSRKNGV